MRKTAKICTVTVSLLVLVALGVAAPVAAVTVADRQVTPGTHERTIWDTTQVSIRKLPTGVNHYGTIHMELYFKNYAADLDLYLLNQEGDIVTETGDQGYWLGWETVDYQVGDIVTEPSSVGDTYYVLVVAFNGASDYFLWGYYPRLFDGAASDPAAARNYYLEVYNFPTDGSWASLTGPRVGAPYAVTPTSMGTFGARLEWPADVSALVVEDDLAEGLMPAWFRQYVWQRTTGKLYIADEGTWAPGVQEEDPLDPADDWYGLCDSFSTESWWDTVGLAAEDRSLRAEPLHGVRRPAARPRRRAADRAYDDRLPGDPHLAREPLAQEGREVQLVLQGLRRLLARRGASARRHEDLHRAQDGDEGLGRGEDALHQRPRRLERQPQSRGEVVGPCEGGGAPAVGRGPGVLGHEGSPGAVNRGCQQGGPSTVTWPSG